MNSYGHRITKEEKKILSTLDKDFAEHYMNSSGIIFRDIFLEALNIKFKNQSEMFSWILGWFPKEECLTWEERKGFFWSKSDLFYPYKEGVSFQVDIFSSVLVDKIQWRSLSYMVEMGLRKRFRKVLEDNKTVITIPTMAFCLSCLSVFAGKKEIDPIKELRRAEPWMGSLYMILESYGREIDLLMAVLSSSPKMCELYRKFSSYALKKNGVEEDDFATFSVLEKNFEESRKVFFRMFLDHMREKCGDTWYEPILDAATWSSGIVKPKSVREAIEHVFSERIESVKSFEGYITEETSEVTSQENMIALYENFVDLFGGKAHKE